jgi:hypothetical protein
VTGEENGRVRLPEEPDPVYRASGSGSWTAEAEWRRPGSRFEYARVRLSAWPPSLSVQVTVARPFRRPPQPGPSRRALSSMRMAVRLLPPADRQRYREEFAAEFADLPRTDQAPYAYRLLGRTWSLRRALKDVRPQPVALTVAVQLASPGAAAAVITALAGAPAVYCAGALSAGILGMLGWTMASADRTRRLVSLIRAARGEDDDQPVSGIEKPRRRRS